MNNEAQSPVFVINEKFKELLEKRKRANELLIALISHPRFKETGSGIFEINEQRIRMHDSMCEFITAVRKKYPMRHFAWNQPEFDSYERFEEAPK